MTPGGPDSGKRFTVLWASGVLTICLFIAGFVVFRAQQSMSTDNVSATVVVQQENHTTIRHLERAHPGAAPTSGTMAGCEARMRPGSGRAPVVAIVGASFTAGVGPDNPQQSWAVDLARTLHWNAVVYGVPGAGYDRPSRTGLGPMSRMLGLERLHALRPALVIIQAGHDDLGVPAGVESARVAATVRQVKAEAPAAEIVLITTFAGPAGGSPALYTTDRAIVTAATAAGPHTIVMDPLTGLWQFQHAHGGLHPTAAGDAWIARTVAGSLRAYGVKPAAVTASSAPVICDVAVGVARPVSAA